MIIAFCDFHFYFLIMLFNYIVSVPNSGSSSSSLRRTLVRFILCSATFSIIETPAMDQMIKNMVLQCAMQQC